MRTIISTLCLSVALTYVKGDSHAQADPLVEVKNGNLQFSLPSGKSFLITQDESINLGDISKHVDNVEKNVEDLKNGLSSDDDVKKYSSEMGAKAKDFVDVLSNKARIDQVLELYNEVLEEVNAMDNTINSVESNFEKAAKDLGDSTRKAFSDASKKVNDLIDGEAKKLNADFDKAKKAVTGVSDVTFYTHWGSKSCKKLASSNKLDKITKRFEGWQYGTQHNNAGGGSQPLCLIDEGGAQGGYRTGGWHDGVRPTRIEHTGNVEGQLRNVNSRIIPCSTCTYPGKCYEEYGVEGCKMEGYSPAYTGFGFAGYHQHWGNNKRVCIDRNIDRNEWNNGGYYVAHVYPTVTVDGTMKRSGGTYAIACSLCCKNKE